MNNNKKTESTPNQSMSKEEIEVFSKDLTKKMKKMSAAKKPSRAFSLRINPLIGVVVIVLILLLSFLIDTCKMFLDC